MALGPVLPRALRIVSLMFPFVIAAAMTSRANAGLWLEPSAGYFSGSDEISFSRDGQHTYRSDGWLLGMRAGWAYRIYYFGLGIEMSHGDSRLQNDSSASFNTQSSHMHANTLSAIFGARKGMFRVYGGYDFQNELVLQTNPNEQTYKGSLGYRAGISIDAFDPISINIEGIWHRFNKYADQIGEQSVNDSSVRSDARAGDFLLSISMPWDAEPSTPPQEPGQAIWRRRPKQGADE
jgi:opacity protein-like surface antigen